MVYTQLQSVFKKLTSNIVIQVKDGKSLYQLSMLYTRLLQTQWFKIIPLLSHGFCRAEVGQKSGYVLAGFSASGSHQACNWLCGLIRGSVRGKLPQVVWQASFPRGYRLRLQSLTHTKFSIQTIWPSFSETQKTEKLTQDVIENLNSLVSIK